MKFGYLIQSLGKVFYEFYLMNKIYMYSVDMIFVYDFFICLILDLFFQENYFNAR